MISRKLLLLAMVALFCMIFIGSTQTALLNKRQAVVYADFANGITGQWTWTSDGFDFVKRADGDFYRFRGLFTRENVKISSAGGTSPFQKVYEGFKVSDFVGGTFFVKHKGKKFSEATIKLP
ncbi:unnamed protein product [Rhizophagus irregularis]|uniref:Uncharacterized protein n=1 Tax=Rhizophagus irregularis TaxID=588596 RepID=A0A2N1MZV9_9GLOM|nr:hypothetical protein RhiirC2_783919 [Rhizophagus irregularis]CAB4382109.1 unnamed protein product [Rhizophagus irregularis]CAB5352174.1 unnamed protein product [Rhizophagus irregularis]